MGLPEYKGGITTPEKDVNLLCDVVLDYGNRSKTVLTGIYPNITNETGKVAIMILCFINRNHGTTLTRIQGYINHHWMTVRKVGNELLCIGLIDQVNKPRKILPFNAYKIDKGYRITPKGIEVLKRLFEV